MNLRLWAALTASTAILTQPVLAQEEPVDLGTLVFSGSLTPVEASRTGASVDIVDGTEMGEQDSTVVDRLVRLPGVNAASNGGLGAQSGIQIRGLPARYVGVRIDGIDVSDTSGTQVQYDFGNLLAGGIDRVEVLKGSQSALYGSEAIGGVINITSFRPTDPGFTVETQLEAGSFDTYAGRLSVGFKAERGEVALTFSRTETDGISARSTDDEDDGYTQSAVNLTASYDLTDFLTVGGAVLYRDSEVEFDRSATDTTGDLTTEETGARVFATLATGAVTHTFSYSYFDIERRDPGGFSTAFYGERQTLAYLGSAELGSRTTLNFGLDYTDEKIDTRGGGAVNASEETTAGFAELLFSPNDQVDLSAALRHDDNSDFGGETTGRLAAVWRPTDDWALRAVLGTGYRSPSLFERYSSFGDPNLQPETSQSFELGAERIFGTQGFVKATFFYTEVDDLIDFDGAATICGSGFGCFNQVPGTTKSQGIELSGEYALNNGVTLFGAYTYTDATGGDGNRFTRTPRHDLVLGAEASLTDRLSGYVDIRNVADVEASAFAPADNLVGDYTVVGTGVSYDVTEDAELYLRIENLFDEDYETAGGFNQPGRTAFFGVRASF